MTILCIVYFIFFAFYYFKNSHKATLLYCVSYIFTQGYLCLRYEPPALTLNFALNFFFIFFYIITHKIKWREFPLYKPFVFLLITYIIAIFVSPLGPLRCLTGVIDLILSYLVVIMFYFEFKNYRDIKFIYKSFAAVAVIMLGYGIMEFLLQQNPIIDKVYQTVPLSLLKGKLYPTLQRFGTIRCQSFMTISISYGGLCTLWIAFLLLTEKYARKYLGTILYWGIIAVSLFGLLSSGSRSPFVYFALVIFPYFLRNNFGTKTRIIAVFACLIGLVVFADSMIALIESLGSNSDTSGSNVDMRVDQLAATIMVIDQYPIFGLGYNGYSVGHDMNSDILGAESIWLQTLLSYGLLGVVRTCYMYMTMIKVLRRATPPKMKMAATFFVLGWVAFCSFTSSPGMSDVYFLIILIAIIKIMEMSSVSVASQNRVHYESPAD